MSKYNNDFKLGLNPVEYQRTTRNQDAVKWTEKKV